MYVVKVRPDGAQRAQLLTKDGTYTHRRSEAALFPEDEARAKVAELKAAGVVAYCTT